LEDAELVAPGIAEDPEVEAALVLVIPALGTEGFQALNFGLNVIGLQVEVPSGRR
jgi:hypothetical protein